MRALCPGAWELCGLGTVPALSQRVAEVRASWCIAGKGRVCVTALWSSMPY